MAGQAMLEEIVRSIIVWIEEIDEEERTTTEKNILALCRRHAPEDSGLRRIMRPVPLERPTDWNVWAEYVEQHSCYRDGHKGVREIIDQWASINGWAPVTNEESFAINRTLRARSEAIATRESSKG
jgi:hypothetical protein